MIVVRSPAVSNRHGWQTASGIRLMPDDPAIQDQRKDHQWYV